MSASLVVVRLDDARVPGGLATVLEISDGPVPAILARYTDRDGARPEWLRLWSAYAGARPGDRCRISSGE